MALPADRLPALALPLALPASAACVTATEEFLLARLANPHTRQCYARACLDFAAWLGAQGMRIEDVRPGQVGAWARALAATHAPATVATRMAGLRRWFEWLRERGVLAENPAASTRAPRPRVQTGTTPLLAPAEIDALYAGFGATPVDLRDRALLSLLLYGFLRVGAALAVRAGDLDLDCAQARLRIADKGGVQRWLPLHASALADLRAYLAKVRFQPGQALFVAFPRSGRERSDKPLRREQVYAMVRRRLRRAGIERIAGCHAFRASGITRFLSQGGRIETAAWLAGHASLRTTQLYDRRGHDDAAAELARLAFGREKGGPVGVR